VPMLTRSCWSAGRRPSWDPSAADHVISWAVLCPWNDESPQARLRLVRLTNSSSVIPCRHKNCISIGRTPMTTYAATIRTAPGQTQHVTVQAETTEKAKALLVMQYGKDKVINVHRT
jgi:hypothetical protein